MQTHAIVELEEGGLNIVVGGISGQSIRVLRSLRLPAADLGRETLTNALRSLAGDVLQGASGVHVVLGERRVQHFSSTVPKMPAADMVAFVVREALRLTGLQAPADALVATRILRPLPGNKYVLGTTAVGRGVFEPIQAAFEANHIAVLGLYSMESCLAMAAPAGNGPVAVLECNSGRARFVLCDGQSPVQVRRFLIGGGGEGNSAALTTQLAMELPRTFDWLREVGQTMPKQLLLGTRVTIDDESIDMLKGDDLQAIDRATVALQLEEGTPQPSLGVSMLLQKLARGEAMPSLLQPPRIVLPIGARRYVSLAASMVAGAVCSWSAIVDTVAWLDERAAVEQLATESKRIEDEIAGHQQAPGPSPSVVLEETRVQAAMSMRRPVSRLTVDVSNAAEPNVQLDELKFASTDRILVTGIVSGNSRREALTALAVFVKRLRALPYLVQDGQDEVGEVQGQRNRFRFRLGMAWRNS